MLGKRILIVGGGPVGLSAALFLNKANHNIKIIQRKVEKNVYSKALLTNTRTLSLLHSVGVDNDILKVATPLEAMKIFYTGKIIYQSIFKDHIIKSSSVHGQRVAILPQSQIQNILEEKLNSQNIKVNRGIELLDIKNVQNNKVQAIIKQNQKIKKQIYDLALGCDGGKSLVRNKINAVFQGNTIEGKVMYMADYKLEDGISYQVGLRLNTQPQPYLLLILPVQKSIFRVISTNPDFNQYLPSSIKSGKQIWNTTFKINHRLSSKLQQRNIFLAGDAAHVHSPLGGRGMNIGIQDVYVFSELLKLNNLNSYDQQRRKILKPLVQKVRLLSQTLMVPDSFKYKSIGWFMNNFARFMPQTVFQGQITFLTGQDHQV